MGSGEEPSSSGKQAQERGLQGRRENPTSTPLPKDFGELSHSLQAWRMTECLGNCPTEYPDCHVTNQWPHELDPETWGPL